jgi:hypothetical protein
VEQCVVAEGKGIDRKKPAGRRRSQARGGTTVSSRRRASPRWLPAQRACRSSKTSRPPLAWEPRRPAGRLTQQVQVRTIVRGRLSVQPTALKPAKQESSHDLSCVFPTLPAAPSISRWVGFASQGSYEEPGTSSAGQPGPGDAFFKWLWDNQGHLDHCRQVSITRMKGGSRSFEEFPDDPDLARFDREDRKFVAVAIASGEQPPMPRIPTGGIIRQS